jgi:hypothetical protein
MAKLLIIGLVIITNIIQSQDFFIGRLKYGGGGDWYSNPSSINNLMKFIERNAGIDCAELEKTVTITENISSFPYLYLTGHGTIDMNDEEVKIIRKHLLNGGFLHADDNYGLDVSFRKLVKKRYLSIIRFIRSSINFRQVYRRYTSMMIRIQKDWEYFIMVD